VTNEIIILSVHRVACVPIIYLAVCRLGYTSLSPHPGYPMPEYANGYSTPYTTSAYSCGYSAGAYQQGAPPNGFSQNPCYSMPPPQQDKLSVSSKDDRYVSAFINIIILFYIILSIFITLLLLLILYL